MRFLPLRGRRSSAALTLSPTPNPTPAVANYYVNNVTELDAALTAIGTAGGKTIACNPGNYGGWSPAQVTYTSPVIVTATYTTNKPVFSSIGLYGNLKRLTIDNLAAANASLASNPSHVIEIYGTQYVTIQNCKIRGGDGFDTSAGSAASYFGVGIYIYGAQDLTVLKNDIQNVDQGISWTTDTQNYAQMQNFLIKQNSVRNYRSDAIIGYGLKTSIVRDNYMSDMRSVPGDHCDGIQIATQQGNADLAVVVNSSDLQFINNLIYCSRGGLLYRSQGIFINDPMTAGYTNITVDGNISLGCFGNSIEVQSCVSGLVCQNNKVYMITYSTSGDPNNPAGLKMFGSTGTAASNLAKTYDFSASTITGQTAVPSTGMDLGTDAAAVTAANAIRDAWAAANPLVPYNVAA